MNASRQKSTEQSSNFLWPHTQNLSKIKYSLRYNKSKDERKKKAKNENYIYDLIKTMEINTKMILDVIKMVKLKQEKKNLLEKRIKLINKLFDSFKQKRKDMINLRTKHLLNNQILQETKRRILDNTKLYEEKINYFTSVINKKVIIYKKNQKKFNEIQIYIRRESQNYPKYKKNFSHFFMTPHILENEYLVKKKNIAMDSINQIKYKTKLILDETNDIKRCNKSFDNLNIFLNNREQEINFYEKINLKLLNIPIVYEKKINLPMNNFNKEINVDKNDYNPELSREIADNGEISIVKQTENYNDMLESNINNTFYEMLSIENITNSIVPKSSLNLIQDK